jgi:hypothetical protein
MPAPATNPLSQGYGAIFAALNGWPAFVALVQPGLQTQVNQQAPDFQPPTNQQAADNPSVALIEGRSGGNPYGTNSKAIQLTATYPLMVRSGSLVIDNINLLETVVYQALINADTVLTGNFPGTLGLPGLIYKWELAPGDFRQRDNRVKRPEWVGMININLTFKFLRSTFLQTTYT